MRVGTADLLFKELSNDVDECYKTAAELGFNAIDLGCHEWSVRQIFKGEMFGHFDKSLEELRAYYQPSIDAAAKYGITFHQMHAPFPTEMNGKPEMNAYIHMTFEKCVHICKMVGAKYIAVHGVDIGPHSTNEQDFEHNFKVFASYIPVLKEEGVMMCIENTYSDFQGRDNCFCCSNAEFLVRLVEALNREAGEECFGTCYDVGHANITGKDQFQEILAHGKHLKILHLHDTDGIVDTHLIPYTARYLDRQGTDWEGVFKALAILDFEGSLNFESDGGVHGFPEELRRDALRLNAAVGWYFAKRIEAYKKEYHKA